MNLQHWNGTITTPIAIKSIWCDSFDTFGHVHVQVHVYTLNAVNNSVSNLTNVQIVALNE